MFVDLLFPARGDSICVDHSYPLYAALSRVIPEFHNASTSSMRFAPISGEPGEPGRLQITDRSHLRVRLPADAIKGALPLAGKSLDVAGSAVRLGPPSVVPLCPASALVARIVTFKHGEEPEAFLKTAKAKLSELGITAEPSIPLIESGPRAGEARRRVVRLKGQAIVGYALLVTELTADDSVRLQEQGLGGRTRMGCGFFLPARG